MFLSEINPHCCYTIRILSVKNKSPSFFHFFYFSSFLFSCFIRSPPDFCFLLLISFLNFAFAPVRSRPKKVHTHTHDCTPTHIHKKEHYSPTRTHLTDAMLTLSLVINTRHSRYVSVVELIFDACGTGSANCVFHTLILFCFSIFIFDTHTPLCTSCHHQSVHHVPIVPRKNPPMGTPVCLLVDFPCLLTQGRFGPQFVI